VLFPKNSLVCVCGGEAAVKDVDVVGNSVSLVLILVSGQFVSSGFRGDYHSSSAPPPHEL
jgi:hypothetical protein